MSWHRTSHHNRRPRRSPFLTSREMEERETKMASKKKVTDHPSIWDDRKPGRVSQDFLDILNDESAKMSAALQNPSNWEGLQRAARQAPAKIAEIEHEMEIGHVGHIGPVEAFSEEWTVDGIKMNRGGLQNLVNLARQGTTLKLTIEGDQIIFRQPDLPRWHSYNPAQLQDLHSRHKRSRLRDWLRSWKVLG